MQSRINLLVNIDMYSATLGYLCFIGNIFIFFANVFDYMWNIVDAMSGNLYCSIILLIFNN